MNLTAAQMAAIQQATNPTYMQGDSGAPVYGNPLGAFDVGGYNYAPAGDGSYWQFGYDPSVKNPSGYAGRSYNKVDAQGNVSAGGNLPSDYGSQSFMQAYGPFLMMAGGMGAGLAAGAGAASMAGGTAGGIDSAGGVLNSAVMGGGGAGAAGTAAGTAAGDIGTMGAFPMTSVDATGAFPAVGGVGGGAAGGGAMDWTSLFGNGSPLGMIGNGVMNAAVGSVIGNAMGNGVGGGTGGKSAPVYQPTNQPGMDANFQWNNAQYNQLLQDQYANTVPYNDQLFNQHQNSPYAAQYQNGMNGVAGQYANAGNRAAAGSNSAWGNAASGSQWGQDIQGGMIANAPSIQRSFDNMNNMGAQSNQTYDTLMGAQQGQYGNVAGSAQSLYGAGNALLNAGFDPQGAMYRQNVGDLVANTRAGEYARGIQMSPAGASVEADALGRFQNDWQNQQLARESQAASSASGAYQGAQGMNNSWANNLAGLVTGKNNNYSGLATGAANLMDNWSQSQASINAANAGTNAKNYATATTLDNAATQNATQAATLPYSTSQQIYGNNVQAMGNYAQGMQPLYSGFNQLQSNALGYMNFGQGAQNLGYNQNMQNSQYMNQLGQQIAGAGGTNWGGNAWSWLNGAGNNWQPNTWAPSNSNSYQPEGGDLGQYL